VHRHAVEMIGRIKRQAIRYTAIFGADIRNTFLIIAKIALYGSPAIKSRRNEIPWLGIHVYSWKTVFVVQIQIQIKIYIAPNSLIKRDRGAGWSARW